MTEKQILVELQDIMGDDRRIAESAWTSSYSASRKEIKTDSDVERVVKMLGGSSPPHGVPFESVVFYFWIRLPIAIDRQYMTHRLQSANGMSGRYRTMPNDFFHIPKDVINILDKSGHKNINQEYEEVCTRANKFYRSSIDIFKELQKSDKISNQEFKRVREILRGVLPQHNMTERTTTINLRSFANLQKQRNEGQAQPEIKFIAERMLEEVESSKKIPIALEVLKSNGWII